MRHVSDVNMRPGIELKVAQRLSRPAGGLKEKGAEEGAEQAAREYKLKVQCKGLSASWGGRGRGEGEQRGISWVKLE